MARFIETVCEQDEAVGSIVRLGLEHEMQHQELLVYDIKHLLCDQFDAPIKPAPHSIENVSGMVEIEGGLFELGYKETGRDAGEPPQGCGRSRGCRRFKGCGRSRRCRRSDSRSITRSLNIRSF